MTTIPHAALPDTITMRAGTLDDSDDYASLHNRIAHHYGRIQTALEGAEIRNRWENTSRFDLSKSSVFLWTKDEAGDDTLVGYIIVFDDENPPVHPYIVSGVHPDYLNMGLEDILIEWGEQRASQAIDRCPPEARVSYRTGTMSDEVERIEALKRNDYTEIRNFLRMFIQLDETEPSLAPFPPGIVMRHQKWPDDLHTMVQADRDGFKDHWGYVETPFEEHVTDVKEWLDSTTYFDEELFYYAWDEASERIAGICWCFNRQHNDPTVAYVDALAVMPLYRKQGLGLAMLRYAFNDLWKRSHRAVALHVDATSLTNATRLYEKAGMHEDQRSINFEKLARDGVEMETVEAAN